MNSGDLEHIELQCISEARDYLDACANSDEADDETQQTILVAIGYALIAISAGQRLDRIGH